MMNDDELMTYFDSMNSNSESKVVLTDVVALFASNEKLAAALYLTATVQETGKDLTGSSLLSDFTHLPVHHRIGISASHEASPVIHHAAYRQAHLF
jgi:hypothetical protein